MCQYRGTVLTPRRCPPRVHLLQWQKLHRMDLGGQGSAAHALQEMQNALGKQHSTGETELEPVEATMAHSG